jgi:hypothetical protein
MYFTIFGDRLMSQTNISIIADTMLQNLRESLGAEAYDIVMSRIVKDYFGEKIDIHTAIIQRPEVFESAFVDLLGQMGRILLTKLLDDICPESIIDLHYSKAGDFAKYVVAIQNG